MFYLHMIVYFVAILQEIQAARILGVFPIPSISHQVVFRRLTLELHKRGHELVVVTTDPVFKTGQAPANYTEIDVHDVSYSAWRDGFMKTSKGNANDLYEQIAIALNLGIDLLELQMKNKEVQALLRKRKEKKFDLLLLEACIRPTMVLTHVFDAPAILISSFGGVEYISKMMGVPTHPILYPPPLHQRLYNLTFLEKIGEIYTHYYMEYLFWRSESQEDEMAKRLFGPNTPTIRETQKNVQMALLNVHAIWEENRPVPPNVIYIGGIHQNPEKNLPKDLKEYLDSSKHGVIYISFGTNVEPSLLPPEWIQLFIKVFSKLPYDVLWKWDKDELPGSSNNIRIAKWLPQSDLLRHPKIKAFITQGGLQSTEEAITAGVPLIGMPMIMDQWYNVEKYVRHNIGLRLDLGSVTEESLRNAINTITGDDSYRQNIARLRSQVYDQPQSSVDRAVWWTEHVLRHGGATHLRAAGALKSWTEYFELNLIAVLLVSFLIVIAFIATLISSLVTSMKLYFNYYDKLKKH
ncbi:antennal-enriched UDP-glycosyltransferase precursor [Bombyx mori]|uniref:UDP-glucuronosyltransferase n=1 Tax=Bombyx mori TaxID=7091 RepID=Q1HPX7_BOMMO|nr:antennal-enriched UDP-glycosyltransferase precursor [Bombyx mori]ABF51364.1 antennal-enriched UDP-glycosyltransferase [Bombyx mori]